jgi:hypothetical protein
MIEEGTLGSLVLAVDAQRALHLSGITKPWTRALKLNESISVVHSSYKTTTFADLQASSRVIAHFRPELYWLYPLPEL